eukprot:jgi/Psemu1/45809/gm1.45809_g
MDSHLSKLTIPIVLKQPKIFLVQGFHLRFYRLPQGNKKHQFKSPSNDALPATSPDNDSKVATTTVHDEPPPPKKRRQSKSPSKERLLVSISQEVSIPEAAVTKSDDGSLKPNKGQTGVQDGSSEGKKKCKSEYPSEVVQHIPGGDLHTELQWKLMLCHKEKKQIFKGTLNGSFGLEDVMEKIEDLVLQEQRYLAQSKFAKEEYEGFQWGVGVGVVTKCSHVRFDQELVRLVKGSMAIPVDGDIHQFVKQFISYDVNSQQKLHQQILMEHIPYVFHQLLFITDPEVLCNDCVDEWLATLTLYSYLPESGKIFTPLTPSLAEKLVEKEEDLFKANLEVAFLCRTEAHNAKANDLYLSEVFKHLKGSNFLYYTLLDLESWDYFFDSMEENLVLPWLVGSENNYKAHVETVMSDNDQPESNIVLPHDDDGKLPEDKDNKNANLKNNGDLKPAAKKTTLKEPGKKNNSI